MSECTNCDQVNDLWDENQKLKKAYAEVCVERDMLKDKILSIKKIANIHYGLTEKIDVISPESYGAACKERDRLKAENKSLYRLCNQLLAEQRGESEDDGLPEVKGKLLTENDIF